MAKPGLPPLSSCLKQDFVIVPVFLAFLVLVTRRPSNVIVSLVGMATIAA